MVSPARIKTNRLLAKAFDLNDFLDPTRLAHDELQYYNDLTRSFDKIISHYINWLDSSEAKKLFYEEIQNREEYFKTIDSDLDDIIQDTSLSADRIIEKVYRKGLSYGYKDINRLPVFNDACKYGLKATQEYNFELISNVSNDLIDSIRHHIFRGIAEGQSIHEVARAITDSGLKPIEGKTLSAYQRASLIARTEIARSMTTGRLQSYANYGVKKVKILTAGDDNVCPICLEAAHVFNGEKTHENIVGERVYDLDKASDLIPFHPACRCSVIAHIEHYQDIPQKPLDDVDPINLVPNDNTSNKKYSYQSAEDEFKELLNDPSVKCSEGHKLKSYTKRYKSDETFYKYEFEGITIYKSNSLDGVPVKKILEIYNDIKYDNLRNSCTEIILSNKVLYDDGIPIGGYVSPQKNNRMYILNQEKGLSLECAKDVLYHEIAHCFDKNHKYSNVEVFRRKYFEDDNRLSGMRLRENQRRVSGYTQKLCQRYKKNKNNPDFDKEKAKESFFAEIFADSVKKILKGDSRITILHEKKYEYINSIIN